MVVNVQTMIDHARNLVDWKYYTKKYPVPRLAGVTALGFIIVSKRSWDTHPDRGPLRNSAKNNRLTIETESTPSVKSVWIETLLSVAAGIVVRSATQYLRQQARRLRKVSAESSAQTSELSIHR